MNAFLTNYGLLILLVAVMYFFFIRPQAKRQKEQQRFIDALEKGKEVVTNAGLIGRILKIEGEIVTLEVDQKTFIRVLRTSISKDMTESVLKDS